MVKVLLADDSVTIQKVVELILPESFELKSVKSGSEALAAIPSFKPDIVLADIEMPAPNGYQLCSRIKGNPATKSIPVVLLAGAFEPLDEGLAVKSGADSSLIKPFEAEDLMGRINDLLGSKVSPAAPLSTLGGAGEEDLWEMEGLKGEEVAVVEEMGGEGEEVFTVEALEELGEEAAGAAPVGMTFGEVSMEAASRMAFEEATVPVEEEFPTEKEVKPAAFEKQALPVPDMKALTAAFRASADDKIAEYLKKTDIKAVLIEALTPKLKESVENVLWEVAPELTEKLIKEALTDTMVSLKKELENVIWETVPELAETIIRKEIEKIRAEGS